MFMLSRSFLAKSYFCMDVPIDSGAAEDDELNLMYIKVSSEDPMLRPVKNWYLMHKAENWCDIW